MSEYFNLASRKDFPYPDLAIWRALKRGLDRLKHGIKATLSQALENLKNPSQMLESNVPSPVELFKRATGTSSESKSPSQPSVPSNNIKPTGGLAKSQSPFQPPANNIKPAGNLTSKPGSNNQPDPTLLEEFRRKSMLQQQQLQSK